MKFAESMTYYLIKGEHVYDIKPYYSKHVHLAARKIFNMLYKTLAIPSIEFKFICKATEKVYHFIGTKELLAQPKISFVKGRRIITQYKTTIKKVKNYIIVKKLNNEKIKYNFNYISGYVQKNKNDNGTQN